jgi:hypothetical protein
VEFEAQGNENTLAFSLHFDARRRFLRAQKGAGLGEATFVVNSRQQRQGRLGVLVVLPPGQSLAAGRHTLLTLHLAAAGHNVRQGGEIIFGDGPVQREVVDEEARPLVTSYERSQDSNNRP